MRNFVLLILVLAYFPVINATNASLPEHEDSFQYLKKDEVSKNAILIIRVKSINEKGYSSGFAGGVVLFSRNNTAYSYHIAAQSKNAVYRKEEGTLELTSYCSAVPGDYEILLANLDRRSGSAVTSTGFDFRGTFTLEAGKVYDFGEFYFDVEKNSCKLNYAANDSSVTEKFRTNYPEIFKAGGSVVNPVQPGKIYPWPGGGTIYSDDFSKDSHLWNIAEDSLHEISIMDGHMVLDNHRPDSSIVSFATQIPESFDVTVDATWISGDNNKSFGLLIGNEPKKCLKFSITGSGYYAITRWDYGKGALAKKETMYSPALVVNWTKSDLVNTTPGATNTIRVQKIPWYGYTVGIIAFYINSTLVARNIYYVSPPISGFGIQFTKSGVIGFYSYGKQSVSFDNFRMSQLKQ